MTSDLYYFLLRPFWLAHDKGIAFLELMNKSVFKPRTVCLMYADFGTIVFVFVVDGIYQCHRSTDLPAR
jgi:hypothetical protein